MKKKLLALLLTVILVLGMLSMSAFAEETDAFAGTRSVTLTADVSYLENYFIGGRQMLAHLSLYIIRNTDPFRVGIPYMPTSSVNLLPPQQRRRGRHSLAKFLDSVLDIHLTYSNI